MRRVLASFILPALLVPALSFASAVRAPDIPHDQPAPPLLPHGIRPIPQDNAEIPNGPLFPQDHDARGDALPAFIPAYMPFPVPAVIPVPRAALNPLERWIERRVQAQRQAERKKAMEAIRKMMLMPLLLPYIAP